MSDKVDWDSAPEEATHWTPETSEWLSSWWKEEPDGWYSKKTIHDTHNWFYEKRDKPYNVEGYQSRPVTQTTWRGPEDGLPPVGMRAEYFDRIHGDWTKQYIVAHHINGEEAIFSS
jgi:hypothetical protein